MHFSDFFQCAKVVSASYPSAKRFIIPKSVSETQTILVPLQNAHMKEIDQMIRQSC